MARLHLRTLQFAVAAIALVLALIAPLVRQPRLYRATGYLAATGDPAAVADMFGSEAFLRRALTTAARERPGEPLPRPETVRRPYSCIRLLRPDVVEVYVEAPTARGAHYTRNALLFQAARDGLGRIVAQLMPTAVRPGGTETLARLLGGFVAVLAYLLLLRTMIRRASRSTPVRSAAGPHAEARA